MLLCPKCERVFRKAETLAKHATVCAKATSHPCGAIDTYVYPHRVCSRPHGHDGRHEDGPWAWLATITARVRAPVASPACDACGDPAEVRATLATLDGTVLDSAPLCRSCVRGNSLGLHAGEVTS